jgi:hypothetical protein
MIDGKKYKKLGIKISSISFNNANLRLMLINNDFCINNFKNYPEY